MKAMDNNNNHTHLRQALEQYSITPKLILEMMPCPAPRMTQSDKWKTNPDHYDPRKRQRPRVTRYFLFKNEFNALMLKHKFTLNDNFNVCFIMPIPDSYSKKKKQSLLYTPHKQKPDRDNLLKSVQDASGMDDGHFWDGRVTKIWGEKPMIIFY